MDLSFIEENENYLLKLFRDIEIHHQKLIKDKDKEENYRKELNILRIKIKMAKISLRSYKMELRELPRLEQEPYRFKCGLFDENLNLIQNDFNSAEECLIIHEDKITKEGNGISSFIDFPQPIDLQKQKKDSIFKKIFKF
ncbi:hypothetical protein ACTFIV_004318 [Dictyostelium citrinum]